MSLAPTATQQISEDVFFETYKPVMRDGDDNAAPLYEHHEVKQKDLHHVWTIVEGDDGGWYALPGFHVVNKIGYTLTEKPWDDENIEAVYFGPMDDDDELEPEDSHELGGMRP